MLSKLNQNHYEEELMLSTLDPSYSGTQEQDVFCAVDSYANAKLKFSNVAKGNTRREKRLFRFLEKTVKTKEKKLEEIRKAISRTLTPFEYNEEKHIITFKDIDVTDLLLSVYDYSSNTAACMEKMVITTKETNDN